MGAHTELQVGRGRQPKLSILSVVWLRKIAPGAHSRRSSKPRSYSRAHDHREYFETPWHRTRSGAKSENDVEGISRSALGPTRGDRFLHHRGVDLFRFDALRCPILYGPINRTVEVGGIASSANGLWMSQIARNLTDAIDGFFAGKRYLIYDRDPLYTKEFLSILAVAGLESVKLPPRSPNLNAHAERFVRTIKEGCLGRLILFGEGSVRRAASEFIAHYHRERNHQGLDNKLICPEPTLLDGAGEVQRRERLGGLLNYYYRAAA